MEFYSALKKNKIMLFADKMDKAGDYHAKGNQPDLECQELNFFSYLLKLSRHKEKNEEAHENRKENGMVEKMD